MTRSIFSAGMVAALLLSGCATKKYVRETTTPISAKVDQVADQANKNGQQIQETQTNVKQVDERAQSGISAAKEQAMTAQNGANDAMNKANQANDLGGKNSQELASLRQSVSNLDDYKQVADATILFGFNKSVLTDKDKQDLDSLVTNTSKNKRFFIAVEGFTDKTGSRQYNEVLSRKRADAVTHYLVAQHDIPIYRIHMIGLGEEKLADEGHGRAANAKNRRVEVKVYSADESYQLSPQAQAQPQSGTEADRQAQVPSQQQPH
jgi:OOP family OmpA-OmpF porin